MTIEDMIQHLTYLCEHGQNPKAIVKSWDPDAEKYMPITGSLYDSETLEFQTDCDDDTLLPLDWY